MDGPARLYLRLQDFSSTEPRAGFCSHMKLLARGVLNEMNEWPIISKCPVLESMATETLWFSSGQSLCELERRFTVTLTEGACRQISKDFDDGAATAHLKSVMLAQGVASLQSFTLFRQIDVCSDYMADLGEQLEWPKAARLSIAFQHAIAFIR